MMNNNANAPAKRVGLLGRLRSWFFTGLLVTAPVLLTVYITWAAINLIDGQVASLVPGFSELRFANVPGVGLVIGVVLITVIGAVAAGGDGVHLRRSGDALDARTRFFRETLTHGDGFSVRSRRRGDDVKARLRIRDG